MFGWIYKAYIATPGSLSNLFCKKSETPAEQVTTSKSETYLEVAQQPERFENLDTIAAQLGNTYRGFGVTAGLLGALVVLLAVLPIGLELEHGAALIVSLAEISLMLGMVALVVYGIRSRTREKWIRARQDAETLRYRSLSRSIATFSVATEKERNASQLLSEIRNILDGPNGQIAYNVNKASQYEAVEQMANWASWLGFVAALSAAVAHLFLHSGSWLIFFTAFVPSMIGALHGINAFLRIGDLVEDHHLTGKRLRKILNEIESIQSVDTLRIQQLAEAAYELLSTRDSQWASNANRLGLKIG